MRPGLHALQQCPNALLGLSGHVTPKLAGRPQVNLQTKDQGIGKKPCRQHDQETGGNNTCLCMCRDEEVAGVVPAHLLGHWGHHRCWHLCHHRCAPARAISHVGIIQKANVHLQPCMPWCKRRDCWSLHLWHGTFLHRLQACLLWLWHF